MLVLNIEVVAFAALNDDRRNLIQETTAMKSCSPKGLVFDHRIRVCSYQELDDSSAVQIFASKY